MLTDINSSSTTTTTTTAVVRLPDGYTSKYTNTSCEFEPDGKKRVSTKSVVRVLTADVFVLVYTNDPSILNTPSNSKYGVHFVLPSTESIAVLAA